MIATRDLRELAAFTGLKAPVLSVYLDTDLSRQMKEAPRLMLRELLDKAREEGAAEEDLQRSARFVDLEYDWQGRGLVIVSCLADGLWQPYPLPVPVRSQVYVGEQPYLLPLSKLLDQYAPYVVALVDQERARLFQVDMGGIVREEDTIGDPVKHQKQGGWSASRYQRHEDKVASRNLRAAADALARFCSGDRCSRLVLAGTEENTARFRDLLPVALRQAVVGAMPLEMGAGGAAVIERSREILADLEEERERGLVERMITIRDAGGPAVMGLADTLFALQEGRVLTLLLEEGFAAPGYSCPSCGYLYTEESQHCLLCGNMEARPVRNVVERAVHKAFEQDAAVEVISGDPALAQAGHIGALLRY